MKVCNSLISMFIELYNQHHSLILEHFYYPLKKPILINAHSTLSPLSLDTGKLIYFLSLWICLVWVFHINGIIKYVIFCDWLLSLSKMFSRFIHVAACISHSIPFYY